MYQVLLTLLKDTELNMNYYQVFGLIIKSEIELPELNTTNSDDFDVSIKLGKVVDHLPDPVKSGILYETAIDDFIFRIKTIAKYRVQDGSRIVVQPEKKASPEEVRLFLYGSTFGALLHQRGILPLHGSAINTENGAIINIGFSSSGKSTLAASFSALGYEIIADDIAALTRNPNNGFVVYPGIPYLRLWKDVLSDLNLPNTLTKVRKQLEKYQIPFTQVSQNEYYPISKIVLIEPHNKKEFSIEQIMGIEKFEILKAHTYRSNYVDGLGLSQIHFNNITTLAQNSSVFKVTRPISQKDIIEFREFFEQMIIRAE